MDWKACAVDDLRRYNLMKIGIINSREKVKNIEACANQGRSSASRNIRNTSSHLIDAIVETERLKENIKVAENLTKLIDRGLASLSEGERRVLQDFYMTDTPKGIKRLRDELGYSPRSLYRMRDNALKKFTVAMYGVELL